MPFGTSLQVSKTADRGEEDGNPDPMNDPAVPFSLLCGECKDAGSVKMLHGTVSSSGNETTVLATLRLRGGIGTSLAPYRATFFVSEPSKTLGVKQRSRKTDRPSQSPGNQGQGPMLSLVRSPSLQSAHRKLSLQRVKRRQLAGS